MLNTELVLGSHSCVVVFNTIYISDTSTEPQGDFKEANYNYLFLLLMVPQKSNDHTCSADLASGEWDIQWLSSSCSPVRAQNLQQAGTEIPAQCTMSYLMSLRASRDRQGQPAIPEHETPV